ncbi:MAG: DUF3808 domain-containing protein [Acidobacteria bacterium]|nr:DUF3808 domain-containing protein [Acidobacteriota bacterium]
MRFSSNLLALAFVMNISAQEPGPGPAGPAPVGGGGGGGGATNPTNPSPGGGFGNTNPTNPGRNPFPGQQQDPNNRFPDMMQNRPIFLSGKVVLEDGTAPPDQVVIERICNGVTRPEGYTDSKGRFSFELGRNNAVMADASTSGAFDDGAFGSRPGFGGNNPRMGGIGSAMGGRGISERDLMGCEIRAQLAGFRSEVVNLAGRRSLDNPDLGTIILRRLANVEGFTFSLTTAMAPKEAKKNYEKGLDLVKKKKVAEATAEIEKATSAYPKYAIAWFELGRLYENQQRVDPAIKAYESAIAADPKYVNPYVNLARLHGQKKEWQKTVEASAKGIKLNPFEFLQLYYVNAVGHMNLGKMDEAEKSIREAMKLDTKGTSPRLDQVLGTILMEKADYAGAKASLESYLRKAPNAADAPQVRNQINQLTEMAAAPRVARSVSIEPAAAPVVSAPVAPPPVTVGPRAAWPSWGGGISDLPPATLSKSLDPAALSKELTGAIYWIYTAGDAAGLNKAEVKYQGAAVAVSRNLLVTNCDVLEGSGATGLYQSGKLVTSSVRLAKSKRAAGMCVLEAGGTALTPVNGVRNAQDLSAGEKTYTLTTQGVGEGKLTSAKTQGGLRLLLSTSPVNGSNNGGGLFDEFGNLIGVMTQRSQNAAISAEEFYQ